MEVTYITSARLGCRVNELLIRPVRKIEYYYFRLTMPLIAIMAATVIAVQAKFYLFALWIAAMAISFLVRVTTHRRFHELAFYPPTLDDKPRKVRLSLLPEGLREAIGDVMSFAPWTAVGSTTLLDDILIVSLDSGQDVLIPRSSADLPPLNLEEIRDEIQRLKESATTSAVVSLPPAES